MLRETLSAVATIRENDRALACLKGAVEAVLCPTWTLACENWYADFGGGKPSDLKATPTRHQLLLKAMEVAFPAPQAGTPQRRYWDRQAARMAEGSLPDGPREGEDTGAPIDDAGIEVKRLRAERDALVAERARLKSELQIRDAGVRGLEAQRDNYLRGIEAMGRAGDALCHRLLYSEHAAGMDAWWRARGGHEACTACGPAEQRSQQPTSPDAIKPGAVKYVEAPLVKLRWQQRTPSAGLAVNFLQYWTDGGWRDVPMDSP